MNTVEDIRKKINAIDFEILNLFEQRLSLMPDLLAYKTRHCLPIYDKERETSHLSELKAFSKFENTELAERLFVLIMNLCKERQEILEKKL